MGNIHAVPGCKISMHQLEISEVLHSFGNLKAHINQSFLGITDLQVRVLMSLFNCHTMCMYHVVMQKHLCNQLP